VRGNVQALFGGEGLVLLSHQDPASYPTLFVTFALTGQKAQALDPTDAETWYVTNQVFQALGQPEAALRAAKHASRLDPESAEAALSQGHLLEYFHQYEEALAALDRSIRLQPIAAAYITKAMALEGLGRHDKALVASGAALQLLTSAKIAKSDRVEA
jgi:tetratricopeptide (TPR) repeat protein